METKDYGGKDVRFKRFAEWLLKIKEKSMAKSLGQIPFGKFKGLDIEDVPDSYLTWIKGEKWFAAREPKLCENIKKEIEYREKFNLHIVDEKHLDGG